MNNEIELKLAVTEDILEVLQRRLEQFNYLCVFLGNTYYDYPNRFLAKQKMGLRIRQEDICYTLTLKTNGEVVGGLHTRPEYNLSLLEKETPTNEQLKALYPFDELPTAPLQPIFSTDFFRTLWFVSFRDSKIEVAFDRGEIVAGERSTPICEIEFELKEGNVEDLFDFVEKLPFMKNIYFNSASKAQRGYQLSEPLVITDWLNKWRDFLQAERAESAVDFQAKFNEVLKMEQALVEETLTLPATMFNQDFMKTVERVGAFFNLYHYYDENKKLLETVVQEKNANNFAELIKYNQYFLNEIQNLIRFHSETKDNKKTIEELITLLKDRLYFERMIHLMKLAV